jgi:hypothetical protein
MILAPQKTSWMQTFFDIIFDLNNIISGWELETLSDRQKRSLIPSLQQISSALDLLMQDPWFTSLWTLQEAVLRRDAMVLSRDGDPLTVSHSREYSIRLEMFCSSCWYILLDIGRYAEDWPLERDRSTEKYSNSSAHRGFSSA